MLRTTQIDTQNKNQVRQFVNFPYDLYKDHPQWVPPIRSDVALMLNKSKHPYYLHSDADFFLTTRADQPVARLAVLENRLYNQYHQTRYAQFYLFDCENDFEAVQSVFEHASAWAKARDLDTMIGPKGFGVIDGYGLLVEGFEHRQLMNMMNYNHPYYPEIIERLGFRKEVDFVSAFIDTQKFKIPERVHRIADRVRERGNLEVKRFKDKAELKSWAPKIGKAYNDAFINNWEYYPMIDQEINFIVENIMLLADHRLMKIITHEEQVVGFLFAFPDISAAMQKINGRLFPFGIVRLLLETRRTNWIALNGAGILPEFQGRGGNALLYSEMEKTLSEFDFKYADLTQVAETAVDMRRDLVNLGSTMYKNHRVYRKEL
jgi:hypothetical protein